jgi:hypothetical protein
MPPTVKVMKARREAAAQRVLAEFGNRLPDLKLLCFFDDQDSDEFKKCFGQANRGFYAAIEHREPCWLDWPDRVTDCILVDDTSSPYWKKRVFDHVIYLHGGTCADETSLTMTFAHELQHFVQHGNEPKLWAENSLITTLLQSVFTKTEIDSMQLNWFDIPIEREARAVSKKIAETLCGKESVQRYTQSRIDAATDAYDAADWKFVQGLDHSTPYDMKRETGLLLQRLRPYKETLEHLLRQRKDDDPAFSLVDLDSYFS